MCHTLRCHTSEDKSSRRCATFPWSFIHLVCPAPPAAVTATSHLHSIKLAGKCCIGITEGRGSARAINNGVSPSLSFGSLLSSSPDSASPQTVNGPTVETAIGMKGWRSVMERTLVIRPASLIFLGRFLFLFADKWNTHIYTVHRSSSWVMFSEIAVDIKGYMYKVCFVLFNKTDYSINCHLIMYHEETDFEFSSFMLFIVYFKLTKFFSPWNFNHFKNIACPLQVLWTADMHWLLPHRFHRLQVFHLNWKMWISGTFQTFWGCSSWSLWGTLPKSLPVEKELRDWESERERNVRGAPGPLWPLVRSWDSDFEQTILLGG